MKVYEVTIKACFVTDDDATNPDEWPEVAILSELSLYREHSGHTCQHVEIEAHEMTAVTQPAKASA